MNRNEWWNRPVTYAAVGGTKAADLMQYPPSGYRPYEKRVRIGHGPARWEFAWASALSWGIQRNSGFVIDVSETPDAVTDLTYTPVEFDTGGIPVAAASTEVSDEVTFGPDGTEFVVPGVTAKLSIPVGRLRIGAPCRVVYIVDEKDRKGFAYGTLAGHPESGEEAFLVERTDDGSVWLTIRSFSRPANWAWWLAAPFLRIAQSVYTRRYFKALTGPVD
ncbi:MAG: DUF1990 domain-containing protein [Homoserinimonas sp.]